MLRLSDRGRTGLGGWRACFRVLACAAGDGGRGRFGGLCATLSRRGGEGGRRGGGAVERCVTCCKATRGVAMSWSLWGGVSGAGGELSFSHSSVRYRALRSRGTRAFRASFKS